MNLTPQRHPALRWYDPYWWSEALKASRWPLLSTNYAQLLEGDIRTHIAQLITR